MVADSSDFDEDIAEMRGSVAVDLAQWIAELAALAPALAGPAPERRRAALGEMRQLAHRIGGTAGIFGFAEVGAPALALERRCIAGLAAEPRIAPKEIARLIAAVEHAGRRELGPYSVAGGSEPPKR